MRGFQPQHYADGGLVQRAIGLIGGRKKQIDEATKVAVQTARQPEPQPAVPSTQDGKFDEKRASKDNPAGIGFADGGRVRPRGFVAGAGTGTSDSIPAQLSNGEYVLPADTVRAVGVDKLDALREATHEPVRGFSPKAKPEEPRRFFADGGLAEDERQRAAPGTTSAGPSTSVGFSAGTLPQEHGDPFISTPKAREGLTQGQQPTAAPSSPAAPAPSAPAPADSGGLSYADNNKAVGQGIKESWNKGNYGEAIGKTVAGSVGMFTTPMIDLAARGGAAAWDGAKGFASGLFGMESSSGSATPAKPAGTASPVPATSQTEPGGTNPPAAAQPASQPARAPAVTTETAAAQPSEVMPGVYQHGRGQYSDNAQGMGFASGFTGKPSAQNMAVADALTGSAPGVQRSPVGMSVEQAQQQGLVGARVGYNPAYDQRLKGARGFAPAAQSNYDPNAGDAHAFTNDLRDPRNLALRNASVGSTIFRTKEEAMAANKAKQANVAGARGFVAAQMREAQQADTMRYQSDNALAGTQEQADASRYSADAHAATARQRNAIDQQRVGIEGAKAGQEMTARGFDIQAAQRKGSILARYDGANDAERANMVKQYPDVFGQKGNHWKPVALQGGTDSHGYKTESVLGAVNEATGEMKRMDGQGGGVQPIDKNPQAIAIQNNPSMSREQKVDALRRLGYQG